MVCRQLEHTELSIHNEMLAAKSAFESKLVQDFAFSNSSKIFNYLHSLRRSCFSLLLLGMTRNLLLLTLKKPPSSIIIFTLYLLIVIFPYPSLVISQHHPLVWIMYLLMHQKYLWFLSL